MSFVDLSEHVAALFLSCMPDPAEVLASAAQRLKLRHRKHAADWYHRNRREECTKAKARQRLKWLAKCTATRVSMAGLRCGTCAVEINLAERRANPRLKYCSRRCAKAEQRRRAKVAA